MGQGDALIAFWLHADPAEDLQAWAAQVAQAVWMEKRYFNAFSGMLGGKGK